MKHLNEKQIAQVKEIKAWTPTHYYHGNRKWVGYLLLSDIRAIVNKKSARESQKEVHVTSVYGTIRQLIKWSNDTKGTPYFKTLIEGASGIYYASPAYGHRDYNKSRVFDKTPETMKLMRIFIALTK